MLSATPKPQVSGAALALAGLLAQRTGQDVTTNRAWRIDATLAPLLRERGFEGLDALVAGLANDPGGRLSDSVVDALLNRETSFYRDAGVIETIADAVAERVAAGRRVRVWSAGCSTGQEPLSLAICLAERCGGELSAVPEIVATDVSATAIARARAGRYSQFEIQRGLPVRRMIDWFEQAGAEWVARADIVTRISYRRANLVADPPPPGLFDVILCRNVLLYFSAEMRRALFDRLAGALRPGGLLILGAGETTIGQTERFAPSRIVRGVYEVASDPAARRASTG